MMGYITDVSKSSLLLVLTSFIWVNSGSAQSTYPNPFAPAPPAASAPAAGSAAGGTGGYPNPFAPVPSGCPVLTDTNVAVCPTSDNSVYYTPDGTFFKIQCAHHHGTATVQITTASSFQICIDKCSQENACNSVNYVPTSLGCTLLSSTGAATVSEASAGQNYAYKVNPPTQSAKDENLVACSTSCPSGKCVNGST
jgi:hypothetical protein